MIDHYGVCKPEPIQLIHQYKLNFVEGNIVKYILRSPFKGERTKDLEKAIYYALLLKPLGYIRCFNFTDLEEYQKYLLLEELIAIEYVIQSDIFGYIEDKHCNQVVFRLEQALIKRKEERRLK